MIYPYGNGELRVSKKEKMSLRMCHRLKQSFKTLKAIKIHF